MLHSHLINAFVRLNGTDDNGLPLTDSTGMFMYTCTVGGYVLLITRLFTNNMWADLLTKRVRSFLLQFMLLPVVQFCFHKCRVGRKLYWCCIWCTSEIWWLYLYFSKCKMRTIGVTVEISCLLKFRFSLLCKWLWSPWLRNRRHNVLWNVA